MAALLAAALIALAPAGGYAQEGRWFVTGVGYWDTNESFDVLQAEFEYRGRPRQRAWKLVPNGGLMFNEDSAFYAWGGIRRDFAIQKVWISIGLGVGYYEQGDSKDLGGEVEFRDSIDITFPIGEKNRLGINYYHMSNAGIYDVNPGQNSLILSYARRVGD